MLGLIGLLPSIAVLPEMAVGIGYWVIIVILGHEYVYEI